GGCSGWCGHAGFGPGTGRGGAAGAGRVRRGPAGRRRVRRAEPGGAHRPDALGPGRAARRPARGVVGAGPGARAPRSRAVRGRAEEFGPAGRALAGAGALHNRRLQGRRLARPARGRAQRAGHHVPGGGLQVPGDDPGAAERPGRDDRARRHPGRQRRGSRLPAARRRPGDPRARHRLQGHRRDRHPPARSSRPAQVGRSAGGDGGWRRVPAWDDGAVTWIAPEVERPEGPLTGPERPMLQAFLDWQRATLLYKCAGLTGEQLARRAIPPSELSLLGLLRHMTKVERVWFRMRFAGEQVNFPFGRDFQAEFEGADPARAAADYARLTEEIKHADAAAANASLDDTFTSNGEVMSLRMIYLHMIEEYARHLGHADLLREQIDGVTGE